MTRPKQHCVACRDANEECSCSCHAPKDTGVCECKKEGVSQCNDCHDGEHCYGKIAGYGAKSKSWKGIQVWEKELNGILNTWANPDDRQKLSQELVPFIFEQTQDAYWAGIKVMQEEEDTVYGKLAHFGDEHLTKDGKPIKSEVTTSTEGWEERFEKEFCLLAPYHTILKAGDVFSSGKLVIDFIAKEIEEAKREVLEETGRYTKYLEDRLYELRNKDYDNQTGQTRPH